MKKIFKFCAILIALLFAGYMLVAFATWNINPGRWSDGYRFALSIISGIIIFMATTFHFIVNDD